MSIVAIAKWLEGLALARFVSHAPYVFPTIETIHVIAIAMVVGSIAIVDLRLLGLSWTSRPVTEVAEEVLPWTWACFLIAALAGALMFISAASKYATDLPFQLKMLLLVFAGVNMLIFHFVPYRDVEVWNQGRTPPMAKLAAGLSLAFWIAIVTCGRLVSFTTQDEFGPPSATAAPAPAAASVLDGQLARKHAADGVVGARLIRWSGVWGQSAAQDETGFQPALGAVGKGKLRLALLGQRPCYGEAQAHAAHRLMRRGVQPDERLEDGFELLLGDAGTEVANPDPHGTIVHGRGDFRAAAIFQGVVQEIRQAALESSRRGLDVVS
jgi:hypothetical protein